ncbi:hypothetical protein EDD18DRAFT_1115668 [Armillaria luteobubalina]|uniref:Uncharacterized protein n=1 Tax=Armillaria luteobubalina TaxID=153913 RepID=A0AA39P1W4_9AGAR|nr:hypothetical protein EDD18DRAFT_1115668 [Armillaria luteobubalina]
MFVITPNAKTVMPHPSLGNREIYMWENYRYGFDDPLQWPQVFVPDYAHYTCLCWRQLPVNNPLRPLYLGVAEYDWRELDDFAIVMNLGRMRQTTFLRLQTACKAVIDTVAGVECSTVVTANMRSHIIMLECLLLRLSDLPMSYQRMHLCHAETQRVARELHALVQYMSQYKPLMDAPESDAPPMPVDDDLIGAFSNNATTVQSFFKVGIPVWRVIPIKDLPGVCVDNVLFTGLSRDPRKYAKIHEFITHFMRWVDPFALSSPIVKHRPDMLLIEANTNNISHADQKKQHIQSGASNRLQDLQHQLLPPIIELWHLALLAVDASPTRCHSCGRPLPENKNAIPHENQYVFPRLDIIATLNTEQKIHSYLISWLRLRGPLFARLTIPELLPPNLYHQEWRTVLGMGFLHGDPASGTAAEKRRIEVRKMMDGFMEELPLHPDNAVTSAFWRGKNYEALKQEECQEILWELAEVNFRSHSSSNVQNLPVMHCFPDGNHLPGQLNIGVANYGLADPLWLRRAPYIFAMKKAMWTWEDAPPLLLSEVRTAGWTEKDFLLVEKTVADYYCDTFWQYFGRAPVLPWQLRHQTSEDYVPEARPQMTTSHSGVYVDVEELS